MPPGGWERRGMQRACHQGLTPQRFGLTMALRGPRKCVTGHTCAGHKPYFSPTDPWLGTLARSWRGCRLIMGELFDSVLMRACDAGSSKRGHGALT
jgi:hypothetical protein